MFEIRPARLDEVPEVARVHAQADWEAYAPLFGDRMRRRDVAEVERMWTRALAAGANLVVAIADGEIVGLGGAYRDRITALYVLDNHKRRGIGRALLTHLLHALHGRGIAEATLDVLAINPPAIAFYAAQGAREVGRKIERDERGEVEDLVMSLPTAPHLPQSLAAIAHLIGVEDDLPEDLSARKKHYLRERGYGSKRKPQGE